MPTISTLSKIEGTRAQGANIHFSGSTSSEREAVVQQVQKDTGAILVPPYDHPDIMLGQGTLALEFEDQVAELADAKSASHEHLHLQTNGNANGDRKSKGKLDAVLTPCGGGGMLSGTAIALHGTGTRVFGAEPSFQGADDARRGVAAGQRVTSVKTLTIADGLRTPLGEHTWRVISNPEFVQGLYAVTEENIKDAMKLVLERMKLVVEPSAVVGLAAVLYNEELRGRVQREAGVEGWDVGVVFSGGNTTVEAVAKLFAVREEEGERAGGVVGRGGERVAENVAG
ncbi:tryptophan synthase beta subunit-like PLP-dependent enzyme [Lophiostoma macrostomum CBS 122681]|uniref:Tryptophan synthase beta subunit-like PLP-dependent enzyme n=1 Tax=Lophiostoma macrostomum CBS 122681 TaxID=1314788 RepID=A0A6A6SZ61_9PLEO|nr:tryptophan synthase beta subunit-like PLP-dependent enzyme [Lophiostoma macrostomum CBS 122681]